MNKIEEKILGLSKTERVKLIVLLSLVFVTVIYLAYLQIQYYEKQSYRCGTDKESASQVLVLIDDSGHLKQRQLKDIRKYLNRFIRTMRGAFFKIGFLSDSFSDDYQFSIGICNSEIIDLRENVRFTSNDVIGYLEESLRYLLEVETSSSPVIEQVFSFIKYNQTPSLSTEIIVISDFIQKSDKYDLRFRENEGEFTERSNQVEQIYKRELDWFIKEIDKTYLYEIERLEAYIWQRHKLFPFFERIFSSDKTVVNYIPKE